VRLVDHLRAIAGNIKSAAQDWDRQPVETRVPFATFYARYGWGRQASELYDSVARVRMRTNIPRTVFECASTLDEARSVASQLLQWADELSTGSADKSGENHQRRTGYLIRDRAQVSSRNARIRGQDTAFDVRDDAELDDDGSDIS
jgi:hypothetical protein